MSDSLKVIIRTFAIFFMFIFGALAIGAFVDQGSLFIDIPKYFNSFTKEDRMLFGFYVTFTGAASFLLAAHTL